MPEKRTSHGQSCWLPAVVACALLIGAAVWASLLIPAPEAIEPRHHAAQESVYTRQRLGIWEGKLARFEGDSAKPAEVYEVAVAALPKEIQTQLSDGLWAENEEELQSLLDDLTS